MEIILRKGSGKVLAFVIAVVAVSGERRRTIFDLMESYDRGLIETVYLPHGSISHEHDGEQCLYVYNLS